MADAATPFRPKAKCPLCGKPSSREAFPFCSAQCKAVDLNRWLSGVYVLPRPLRPEDETDE